MVEYASTFFTWRMFTVSICIYQRTYGKESHGILIIYYWAIVAIVPNFTEAAAMIDWGRENETNLARADIAGIGIMIIIFIHPVSRQYFIIGI